jgi:hypothetical protein
LLAEVVAGAVVGLTSPVWLPASALLLFAVAVAVAVARPRRVSFTALVIALGAWVASSMFQTPGEGGMVVNPLTHGRFGVVPLALAVALVSGC